MTETLVVDDLTFQVRRSSRRKTLELVVDRDSTLRIVAPDETDRATMEAYARTKRFWVYSKLAEKEALQRPTIAKQYVSGEGFSYLGRRYRLLLVSDQERYLKLAGGRFRLQRTEAPDGREHFIRWYTEHAQHWLEQRVQPWTTRMGVEYSGMDVRDLGYRWASCGKGGRLYFHWAAIQASPSLLDYIVVHELAHLVEAHHTPTFWRCVERAMPDYQGRLQQLAEAGRGFWL